MIMEILFTLVVPRDEISVPVVRRVVGNALKDLGVAETCRDDIRLAVTEACTNVLKHTHDGPDTYEVALEITNGTCAIHVADSGSGFDAALARGVALGDAESGRGIHLMRAVVDDVRFASKSETGTVVHLEKTLECTDTSLLELVEGTSRQASVSSR